MSVPPRLPDPPDPAAQDREAGAPARGRTGRAVALGIAVLGLLSLVALASQGPLLRAGTQDRHGRLPAWTTEVLTILVVLGAAVFVYGAVAVRYVRPSKTIGGMGSLLIIVALALVAGVVMHNHNRRRTPEPTQKPVAVKPAIAARSSPKPSGRPVRTGATWLEVMALGTAAIVALGAATRPRRVASGSGRSGDPLVALVDDSLEDVRAEPDPRRAVIAAYARMELGATGLAREPAETALEYLRRILAARQVSPAAATGLTGLFEQAKFSQHPVGPAAKQEAIVALEAVRDELRATTAPVTPGPAIPAPAGPAGTAAPAPASWP